MILFINDCDGNNSLGNKIKNQLIENLHIRYEIMEYCKTQNPIIFCDGCFDCWIKTPGICKIKDVGIEINKAVVNSEIFIVLSKITYGGYSSYIKSILERNLPNLLPFYTEYKGRTQLKERYDRYPLYITIGYGEGISQKEEEVFRKISSQKSGNVKTSLSLNFIVKNEDDIRNTIKEVKRFV